MSDGSSLTGLVTEAAETYVRMSVANALAVERGGDEPVRVTLREGLAFEAPPAKYNRKILASNLELLERVYAAGGRLPAGAEEPLLAELHPLAAAGSSLLAEAPALRARL